jgi:hypothetical protein
MDDESTRSLDAFLDPAPRRTSRKPRMTPEDAVEMAESGMEDITAAAEPVNRRFRILEAQRDPVREIQAQAELDKVYREKRTDALSKILQAQRDRKTGGGFIGGIARAPGNVAEQLTEYFGGPESVLPVIKRIQPARNISGRQEEIASVTPGINERALKAATEAYQRALLGEKEEAVETPAETPALMGPQRP